MCESCSTRECVDTKTQTHVIKTFLDIEAPLFAKNLAHFKVANTWSGLSEIFEQ